MGVFADVIKVMKSNLFKTVLENGDYRVSKANVADSISKTLPIKEGGTEATNVVDARKKLDVPYTKETYIIGTTHEDIRSGNLDDYNKPSMCGVYGLRWDDVAGGKIKGLPTDIAIENADGTVTIVKEGCGKVIVETDYHQDAPTTVVTQTLIYYNHLASDPVMQYIRKCYTRDGVVEWGEWEKITYKSDTINGYADRDYILYESGSLLQAGLISFMVETKNNYVDSPIVSNCIVDIGKNYGDFYSSTIYIRTQSENISPGAIYFMIPPSTKDGFLRYELWLREFVLEDHLPNFINIYYKYLAEPYEIPISS